MVSETSNDALQLVAAVLQADLPSLTKRRDYDSIIIRNSNNENKNKQEEENGRTEDQSGNVSGSKIR